MADHLLHAATEYGSNSLIYRMENPHKQTYDGTSEHIWARVSLGCQVSQSYKGHSQARQHPIYLTDHFYQDTGGVLVMSSYNPNTVA